jgi:hypothetical protein
MSTQYTPGPWSLGRYDHIVDASGEEVRVHGMTLSGSPTAKANARLIATAPDLLAALQEATDWIVALSTSDNSCDPPADVSEYQTLIAKAKGEQA